MCKGLIGFYISQGSAERAESEKLREIRREKERGREIRRLSCEYVCEVSFHSHAKIKYATLSLESK